MTPSLVFNIRSMKNQGEMIQPGLTSEEAEDEKAEQIDQHLKQNR